MKTEAFDYTLPNNLIARYPLPNRRDSRLLVVDKNTGSTTDDHFSNIHNYLKANDCLVLNNTKVIPARWFGRKQSGGQIECMLERITADAPYPRAFVHLKASKAPKCGSDIILNGDISATVLAKTASGLYEIQFNTQAEVIDLLQQYAEVPLPPYFERAPEVLDDTRYQTVFAESPGAVAAPTAGLHFDQASLDQCQQMGVKIAKLTLHVGAGTFQPVRVDNIQDHQMHAERYQVDQTACDLINQTKAAGGRVIAVGTTVVRTLETLAKATSTAAPLTLRPAQGESQLFISPGFEFNCIDAMITNFHLPKSSLLMLVSAFAGRENILNAYQHAISQHYRFFSYGDAMLLA